ncbi:MAG: beta-N-acetylhexosaminidase [Bacteroidetes bacterium]|nr:MAG: beta-N-acetylhexosaminidase [Bacteroidota bacterium]
MTKRFQPLAVFFVLIMLTLHSCSSQKWPGSGDISITWEVLSNTYSEQAKVKAEFVIENNSQIPLDDQNWELYFNKSPRFLLSVDEASRARVEQISGDWYRIYPVEGFSLAPGERVSIVYENRYWWIKETDAPKGLYFVFTDEQQEETIVQVDNFRIMPFEREEQLTRHQRDREPVPSPEILFAQNQSLAKLPAEELIPVVPSPYFYSRQDSIIPFNSDYVIVYEEELAFEAHYLQKQLKDLFQLNVDLHKGSSGKEKTVVLSLADIVVNDKTTEVYTLEINSDNSIAITGADAAGLFYGVQSFLALFDPQFALHSAEEVILPVVRIEDAPRFGYRGVHVDVSRNFHSVASLKKTMDILAFYKINTLHLHLTDDEGWRLEIPGLPELTQVGGQRGHTSKEAPALHPSYGSGPVAYAEGSHGSGFYTKEQFIELLQYARQRHIRVIPEINMPGHARAAIKAMEARYLYYMDRGDKSSAEEFRLIDPEETSEYLSAQLFTDNVVNVARESTYRFFETVLDEVIDMYRAADAPLEIIHVGGDEVPRGAWSASPMIEELMAQLDHIDNPQNMHAYFTERTLEIITARGLKMAGWEEVALKDDAEGNHVPNVSFADGNVIPYVWNNLWGAQDLAYRLANRGFPVVLCHVTAFYFDLAYNKDPKEPGLYWAGFVNTRNAWFYSPYNVFQTTIKDNMGNSVDPETEYRNMERLLPSSRKNIMGVQAQLWSETIIGPERLAYYLLPKLAGFAESAWAAPRSWETADGSIRNMDEVEQQWNQFANTLGQRELPRLAKLFGGFNYRVPPPGAIIENGMLLANVEFPGLTVRYTLDGTEPNENSPLFTDPVNVSSDKVKLKAFDAAGKSSRSVAVFPNRN